MMKSLKIFFDVIILFSALNCLNQLDSKTISLEQNEIDNLETITINITYEERKYIGQKGYFYFETAFNDNETNYFNNLDIEETSFNVTFRPFEWTNTYYSICRLWKSSDGNMKIICKFLDDSYNGYNLYLYIKPLNYKSLIINFIPPEKGIWYVKDDDLSFIYSDEQVINITEEEEFYDLKFNMEEYYDDLLFLFKNETIETNPLHLDKCAKSENYLICKIKKEEIEEILEYNNQIFDVYTFTSNFGIHKIELINNIIFNYNIEQKQNITVNITNLLQKYIDRNNYIAYETNVTDISDVSTGKFYIKKDYGYIKCYLKKAGNNPLLFLCHSDLKGGLGKIEEIVLDNINIKYNFRILSINNEEYFYKYNIGSTALFVYPKVLDFNSNEELYINYVMKSSIYTNGIRLNLDSNDLNDGYYIGNSILSLRIDRHHFRNNPSGYYNTYHFLSSEIGYVPFYEFSPIKVIIPDDDIIYISIRKEDNPYEITAGRGGTLYFVTDYIDNKKKIIDKYEIEKISFETSLIENSIISTKVNCKFLKRNDNEKVILICNLIDHIGYSASYRRINDTYLINENYSIYISSNEFLLIHELTYPIPFIYSEEQIITINEQEYEYNLRFKCESYNNEKLILYGSQSNMAVIDNCKKYDNILNCKISKEKIEEILTKNSEQFNFYYYTDFGGIYNLEYLKPITINYDIAKKEDIYVGITEILNRITDKNIPFAFKTNITSIPNLLTNNFDDKSSKGNCFFKKTTLNPLLLLCVYYQNYYSYNITLKNELILKDIHYKYNFRIQPVFINTSIFTEYNGASINLAFPEELDFVSKNKLEIRFVEIGPYKAKYISLLYPDTNTSYSYLNCIDLLAVKVCQIQISYFVKQNYKKNNYCYVYHSDNIFRKRINYGIPPIKVILPKKILYIDIEAKENTKTKIMCKNSKLYLMTNYDDSKLNIFDSSTIEEKTNFTTQIVIFSLPEISKLSCRLWKPKNKNITIICDIKDNSFMKKELSLIAYFNETAFDYNGYRVVISPDISLNFQIINTYCPFLYFEEQSITVMQEEPSYELRFMFDIYNFEPLFLSNTEMNYINLNYCLKEEKNLICIIEKEKLLEQNNDKPFKLYYYDEKYGFLELEAIYSVWVNSNIKKENINIKALNLMQKNVDLNNYVTYKTDITDISNVISDSFFLNSNNIVSCYFKKTELNPLLILCHWNMTGKNSLGEIKKEIILNNIHMKYNFRIQPVTNNEIFDIESLGNLPLFIYPHLLNFYLNDIYHIDIIVNFTEKSPDIMINSHFLECNDSLTYSITFLRCYVKKDYFDNRENNYYYIQHKNHLNDYSIFYELSPLYVNIPKDNEIIMRIKKENNMKITIGKNGVLYFITNYYDENNLFDYNDIENKFVFESEIFDENQNEYYAKCKLWKTSDSLIRIICDLKENLKYSHQNIKLKEISFDYNNYVFYIVSPNFIEVNQVDYSLPFLYSDIQYITINNSYYSSSYNLIFKIESYNNDILFLNGSNNNYVILDNCKANSINNILTCEISYDKLNEVIILKNENLTIGALNDNLGVYKINSIFPIRIQADYNPKINIYVNLVKPFGLEVEKGVPFGYITNVTNIPNLITLKKNNCYFKKVPKMPLLFACTRDREGEYEFESMYSSVTLNTIHWKYNFIFPWKSYYETFKIYGTGTNISLVYPESLDFSKDETLILRYIILKPSLIKNIKLKDDSSNIECHNLNEMKLCKVSFAHFRNEYASGNYNTSYSNNEVNFTIYYDIPSIFVNLPEVNIKEFAINEYDNNNILYTGTNNILHFVTNYKGPISNILTNSDSTKLSFNTTFSNDKNDKVIDGTCELWQPENENVRLVCKLSDTFDYEEQNIYLNEYSFNYYNNKLIFYTDSKNITVRQLSTNIANLYSDKQEININDQTDTYELKFKKGSYSNEQLVLYKNKYQNINLECSDKITEIICNIKRDNIIKILSFSGEKFYVSQLINSEGMFPLNSISDITIISNNIQKNVINLEITKLLTPYVDMNTYIVYETNIKDIPQITTNYFSISSNKNNVANCIFKKSNENKNNNLLLLCIAQNSGEYSLGKINEITLDDINVLYNFKIAETNNNENFTVSDYKGTIIYSVYPKEIDFNKQDLFIISYEIDYPERVTGIKLNYTSKELECENKNRIKECKVTQAHFTKNGDYNTYIDNSFGYVLIAYEIPTIKVTLKEGSDSDSDSDFIPDSDEIPDYESDSSTNSDSDSNDSYAGIIVGCIFGFLILMGIVIFLFWRYKRKNSDGLSKEIKDLLDDKIELKDQNNQ